MDGGIGSVGGSQYLILLTVDVAFLFSSPVVLAKRELSSQKASHDVVGH